MDPANFLKFAKLIEKNSPNYLINEETDCRTGIGRAQYSVFLEYREEIRKKIQKMDNTLASKYQKLSNSGLIHGIILDIIWECDRHLRNLYRNLRNHRNTADYVMTTKISITNLKAVNQLADQVKNNIWILQQAHLQKSRIKNILKR